MTAEKRDPHWLTVCGRLVLVIMVMAGGYWLISADHSPFGLSAVGPPETDATTLSNTQGDDSSPLDFASAVSSVGQWVFADSQWSMAAEEYGDSAEAQSHLLDVSGLERTVETAPSQLDWMLDLFDRTPSSVDRVGDVVRRVLDQDAFRLALFTNTDGRVLAVRMLSESGQGYSLVSLCVPPAAGVDPSGFHPQVWTLPLPDHVQVTATRSDMAGRETAKFLSTSRSPTAMMTFWEAAGWSTRPDPRIPNQWQMTREGQSFAMVRLGTGPLQSYMMIRHGG